MMMVMTIQDTLVVIMDPNRKSSIEWRRCWWSWVIFKGQFSYTDILPRQISRESGNTALCHHKANYSD